MFNLRRYPNTRLRRTRQTPWSRRLVRETQLSVNDLIWPLFVVEGNKQRIPIPSLPGVYRLSIDQVIAEAKQAEQLGIPAVALFPVVDTSLKNPSGIEAINPENLICRTIRALKAASLSMGIICDVALDPYTTHGHDGILNEHGEVANDETVAILTQQALIQTQAGCDIVAPSDMQDGRVRAIRQCLDQHGFHQTLILSYAAKYCSHFYGPFRDAIGSSKHLGVKGKDSYQQDYANKDEALHEIALDLEEGADMVMIKPGMPYLDVIAQAKQTFKVPTFAYQVSGEYRMLQALADNNDVHFIQLMSESLTGFKRAGCDGVFTYAAKMVAHRLCQSSESL